MPDTPQRKVRRGTFEDVRINLQELRKCLDRLIDEERALRPDERDDFLETVDRALMGMGKRVEIEGGLVLKSSNLPGRTTIKNIEDLLRILAYHDAKVFTDDGGADTKIEDLWKEAREKLLVAFPVVLEPAARMSAERDLGYTEADEV